MIYLVTGVAGFIGSHITDSLIEQGHTVVGLDDLSSGTLENINKQCAFFQYDLSEVEILFERHDFDVVIHCAAQTNVLKSIEDPTYDAMENIFGSLSVLEAMRKYNVKRIIFLSTGGAIYGETETPATEKMACRPLSPYGIAKYSIENYLNFYSEIHGFQATILRLSNVYGPRNKNGITNLAIDRFKAGKKLSIYGGFQRRDYIYVSDVVSAVEIAIKQSLIGVYNVGTGIETSLRWLIKMIAGDNKEWSKLVIQTKPKVGEIQRSCLDASKLLSEGWKPEILLQDGIDFLKA